MGSGWCRAPEFIGGGASEVHIWYTDVWVQVAVINDLYFNSHIYATLAVRLARSGLFKKQDLWKNAVTYATLLSGGTCGMYVRNIGEGHGDLTLFFDRVASRETRYAFTEYVHLHLLRRVLPDSLKIRYVLTFSTCATVIHEDTVQRRKERNMD